MALVFDMNGQKHDGTRRAPAAREKLQQAEAVLAEFEADVALLALEASEGKAGADKALAGHRSKIELAARSVTELRRAVLLADTLDRKAAAGEATRIRREQLSAFCKYGKTRLGAVDDVMKAAATMASAMQTYGSSTQLMVGVLPAGTSLPVMNLGPNGTLGGALGNLELLLAAEFYRLGSGVEPFNGQRYFVPFAKQPTLGNTDHTKMQSGMEAFCGGHAAIIKEIEGQLAKIDAEDMNVAGGEPIKGAA
jgi:hypothetical protein